MNNASGRLDDRYGDTVVELYGERCVLDMGTGSYGHPYTNWYLGNRMRYTRMLHGNWCPDDCPLNEWWICGAYYKDNLFREFTSVDAVIGFPKSDCEDWYIGSEDGWNDEPSEEFWQREDVQKRVAEILAKLPFKYEVKLKVTDDEGDGFSDAADYEMTIHAPLEAVKLLKIYETFLPEEGRSRPDEFIPSEAYGAIRLTNWLYNYSRSTPVTGTVTVEREDTFSGSISGSIECSFSGERNVPVLGMKLVGAKAGVSGTISTSRTYRVGMTLQLTASPLHRCALFSQRAATIEEWLVDAYNWNGYQGTGSLKLWKDIRFEFIYWEEPIRR